MAKQLQKQQLVLETPPKHKSPGASSCNCLQKKKRSVLTYNLREQVLLNEYISKVLQLRKIESLKQIYQQLPQIKQYLYDSYQCGELGVLKHKPTSREIDLLIEKHYR